MEKQLRILYICKSSPENYKGGIQTHTWQLAKSMMELEHKVSILTAGRCCKPTFSLKKEGLTLVHLFYFPGRVVPLFGIFLEEFLFNVAALLWVWRHQDSFDVIHLQGRSGYLIPLLLKRKTIAATSHGILPIEFAVKKLHKLPWQDYIHYRLTRGVEPISMAKSKIIAVSYSLKEDIRKKYFLQGALQVIPNGVEIGFMPGINYNSRDLLFAGRIEYSKGIFDLLEAMKLLPDSVRLHIAGDGGARKDLLERISVDPELKSRITYHGSLSQAELRVLMNRSLALVLPSYLETQGLVILEANAQGIPALASDIPGIDEILKPGVNGLLFKKGSPQAISEAVKYLLKHPKEASRMGCEGKALVEREFSWRMIADRTIKFYQEEILTVAK
jgi:glycosyltransferase involved in cell wall biosynthesis